MTYNELTKEEKQLRIKYLWHRAFTKARGASHILMKFGDLNKKIYMYGATKKIKRKDY